MPITDFYILNADHEPVREPDMLKGAKWFQDFSNRIVAQHEVGESHVSTVFLCLDHNFKGTGPPVLFETLVQGGPMNDHQERYSTWSEAVAGHTSILRLLAEQLGQPFTEVAKWSPKPDRPRKTYFEHLLEDSDG